MLQRRHLEGPHSIVLILNALCKGHNFCSHETIFGMVKDTNLVVKNANRVVVKNGKTFQYMLIEQNSGDVFMAVLRCWDGS